MSAAKQKKPSFVRASGNGPGVVNRVTMPYQHRTTKRLRSRAAKRRWAISDAS